MWGGCVGWDIICEIKDFFLQSGGDDATMELVFSWGLVVSSLLPPFLGLWTVGGRGGSWGRRLRRRWRDPFSDWRSELGTLAVQSIGGGGGRSTSTLAPGGSYCEKDTESTGFSIVKRRGGGRSRVVHLPLEDANSSRESLTPTLGQHGKGGTGDVCRPPEGLRSSPPARSWLGDLIPA